jgi:hypothetical protein
VYINYLPVTPFLPSFLYRVTGRGFDRVEQVEEEYIIMAKWAQEDGNIVQPAK